MALTLTKVNHGTVAGDGTGDSAFDSFADVNTTFDAIKVAVDLNTLKNTNVVQTDLTSISDTKANFDTACSDGNFMYSGDAPTAHDHSGDAPTAHTHP